MRDSDALRRVTPLAETSWPHGVLSRFRDVVLSKPAAVAVTDRHGEVTFAELAAEAAAVLHILRTSTPTGNQPIALLHSHGTSAVAALLGIVASGHPVLVLDQHTPAARLKSLVDRVEATTCVSDSACLPAAGTLVKQVIELPRAAAGARPGVSVLDEAAQLWADPPPVTSVAAVAFTSGSTGRPKVVTNDHQMLVRDAWVNSYATGCYTADDVIAHTLPMAFHAGLMATFAGLLVGCTMKLYDVRAAGIGGLAGWLQAEGATVMQASPGILRALISAAPQPGQLAGLRSLTIAGEAAYARDVAAIRPLLSSACVIRNRYGSSETGLIAEYAITADRQLGDGALPTGFGVGDTVLRLIRADGTPVPPGESGIITVTASKTATGYWNDPVNTAVAFTSNPDGTSTYRTSDLGRFDDDGRLTLLGRSDHSVKIRGYLVEPGEVDAALFALDDVREAVVVGTPRPGDGLMRLVAYVVSTAELPSAVRIREALHARLPGYMVPETVVFLEALPRTDRGKVDRAALPQPPSIASGRGVQEFSEWEDLVGSLWSEVLGLPEIGLDDDFFELGGDSLAAEALLSLMVSKLGVRQADASSALLVQAPTLGAFARRLQRKPDAAEQTLIPLRSKGSLPPVFVAAGGGGLGIALIPLIRHLDPEQPVYALQARALERRGLPDWSVRATARRHIKSVRAVQPAGPYYLAGHSFGGIIAVEMAHQLRRAGQEVALLAILDSFPPDPSLHTTTALPSSAPARIRRWFSLATTGLHGGQDQYWRFIQQSDLFHRRYRCDPWPGFTLVVLADTPERAARAQWAAHLTGQWRLVEVRGDHNTMLREPHAAETAGALTEALVEARRHQAEQRPAILAQ